MLYICIFSNKFDLKQSIRVLHTEPNKGQNIYNKVQFESQKHLHQTIFETLKYLQQAFF